MVTMELLEYEAKAILRSCFIPTPAGTVVFSGDTIPSAPIVLKSQVHTGGRGKLGGVRVVKSGDTRQIAKDLFALSIKDEFPKTLLAEELLDIKNEYYLSLQVNRSEGTIELIAHREGGIEVESHQPSEFFRHELSPELSAAVGDSIADYFELPEKSFILQDLLQILYDCFVKSDALLLEINPLVLTSDDKLVAGDCKMTLDADAGFRHPEWNFEQMATSANFVTLSRNGTVATIANGAGLAMATVDAVKAVGHEPANFLDIGGGATVEGIVKSFRSILDFPNVNAIIINIFGGIVRCDDVAAAIIEARKQFPNLPSLYVRLSGNRSAEAADLLAEVGLALYPDLTACLQELTHE